MSAISLKGVSKTFGSVKVLKGIDLEVKAGEFMVFVGPSGCGKSTLLRSICGLENITSGSLSIGNVVVNDVPPSQRGIAMVFQSYALYPHMSVFENIGFALENQKLPKAEIHARVSKVAELLQLTPYLTRLPKALSGGQRQRVAIGRAIVRGARVFLFDEPLSNLDAALRVQMRLEIAKLHHSMPDTTMIYVTHDQVEAMTLADRICVLRDGLVEQVGTPLELYEKPANLFVAGFIGSPKMNIFEGDFAKKYKAHAIGVRAEHLEFVTKGGWSGTVIHSETLGSDSFVFVELGTSEPVIVRESGTTKHKPGAKVSVAPQKDMVHLFGEDGRAI